MKTIIRIAIILVVMLVISGGYWFVVNQTNLISSDEMPAMTDGEMPERPEMDESAFVADGETVLTEMPDHHEASSSRGFSELLTVLVKIIVIAAVAILLQVLIERFTNHNKLNQITEKV